MPLYDVDLLATEFAGMRAGLLKHVLWQRTVAEWAGNRKELAS